MCEYRDAVAQRFWKWSPDPFHSSIFKPVFSVLKVKPWKDPCIHSHLSKKPWVGIRMAKWVYVPADSWPKVEFSFKKLMANHHVVHHIVMMSASFIVHGPTGIHKIETFLLNQVSYLILHFISLTIPPHGKELHLHLCESLFWIFDKFIHDCIKYHLNLCLLNMLLGSGEVFIDGLEPTNIIVWMWAEMHIYVRTIFCQGLIWIYILKPLVRVSVCVVNFRSNSRFSNLEIDHCDCSRKRNEMVHFCVSM